MTLMQGARKQFRRLKSAVGKKPLTAADRQRGRLIKAVRENLRESQAVFGERFGVEQATVSRWEQGEPVKRTLAKPLAQLAGMNEAEFMFGVQQAVPLISWVSASGLADPGDPGDPGDIPMMPTAGLGTGDWFALEVEGDSMNRIAPAGSIIFVNRNDKVLVPRGFYIFCEAGNTTFKRYADAPPRLEPYSTNPAHEAIFPQGELTVCGRVWRIMLDLQ